MKAGVLVLIALVIVAVVFGGQIVGARNEMVTKKNTIEGSGRRWKTSCSAAPT
jgi:hypothetical protein